MMILFFFDYTTTPFGYKPSKKKQALAYKYKTKAIRKFRKKHDAKNIGKGLREMINSYAIKYGFDYGKFISRNFIQDKKHMNLKIYNDLFRGTESNNPWCCDKFNYRIILQEIEQEAESIAKMNIKDTSDKSFSTHVTLPSKITDNVVKKTIISDNKSRHPKKNDTDVGVNPLCSEVRHKLGELWTPYDPHHYTFKATYDGIKTTSHHNERGALLVHVYHNHTLVSTHNWLWNDDLRTLKNMALQRGQKIMFSAIVIMYKKHIQQTNGGVCDFNIQHLTNIHVIGDNDPKRAITLNASEPSTSNISNRAREKPKGTHDSKATLAEAVGHLYDTQQLQHLINIKMTLNDRNISQLNSRLSVLRKRITILQNQDSKLRKERNEAHAILSGKAPLHKTSTEPKHHRPQSVTVNGVTLVGSGKDLKIVTRVWNDGSSKRLPSSHLLGLYHHLVHFADAKNMSFSRPVTVKAVRDLAVKYQHAELKALIEYYTRDSYTTIKSIETDNGLVHGSLLRLRRDDQAQAIVHKKLSKTHRHQYINKDATKRLLERVNNHNA